MWWDHVRSMTCGLVIQLWPFRPKSFAVGWWSDIALEPSYAAQRWHSWVWAYLFIDSWCSQHCQSELLCWSHPSLLLLLCAKVVCQHIAVHRRIPPHSEAIYRTYLCFLVDSWGSSIASTWAHQTVERLAKHAILLVCQRILSMSGVMLCPRFFWQCDNSQQCCVLDCWHVVDVHPHLARQSQSSISWIHRQES